METARGITFFFLRRSAICPCRFTYAAVMLEKISRIGCGGSGGHASSLTIVERAVEMMALIVPGLADRLLSTLLRTSRRQLEDDRLCEQRSRSTNAARLRCRRRSLLGRCATTAC